MIDLSEFRQPVAEAPCAIRSWLSGMDTEGSAKFKAAFDDSSITLRSIIRVARSYGARFSESTAQRHRRGECSCR